MSVVLGTSAPVGAAMTVRAQVLVRGRGVRRLYRVRCGAPGCDGKLWDVRPRKPGDTAPPPALPCPACGAANAVPWPPLAAEDPEAHPIPLRA